MKSWIWSLMLLLAGCKISFETPKDHLPDSLYFKKKVSVMIIEDKWYSGISDSYKTNTIDSIFFDHKNFTIRTVHIDSMPGCFENSFTATSYLDPDFRVYATIGWEEDNFQLILRNYKHQNLGIDSLMKDKNYRKTEMLSWTEQTGDTLKQFVTCTTKLDSTVYLIVYLNTKPIQDIYAIFHHNGKFNRTDTIHYVYQGMNKRLELKNEIIKRKVVVKGNKMIVYKDSYNDPVKDVYISKGGLLWEHRRYKNDTLNSKTVYQFKNGLLFSEKLYNYQHTTRITKTYTVPGKIWDGHDSVPKFKFREYDSTYYDYRTKPSITSYTYSFNK